MNYQPAALARLLAGYARLLAADPRAQRDWLVAHAVEPDELVEQVRDLLPVLPDLEAAGVLPADAAGAVRQLLAACGRITDWSVAGLAADPAWPAVRAGAADLAARLLSA
jgi:hypothetical protein